MSRNSTRAAAGLAVALSLAAFTWPAAADDDAAPTDGGGAVRAASVSEPVIVGSVDDDASAFSTGKNWPGLPEARKVWALTSLRASWLISSLSSPPGVGLSPW